MKEYQKACSGITYDLGYIRRICEELANSIRWGGIPNVSNQELNQFCRSCYDHQNVTDDEIVDDIKEIKNLLIETSLRNILAEQASDKLRKVTEEIFSRKTDFPISLSSLE